MKSMQKHKALHCTVVFWLPQPGLFSPLSMSGSILVFTRDWNRGGWQQVSKGVHSGRRFHQLFGDVEVRECKNQSRQRLPRRISRSKTEVKKGRAVVERESRRFSWADGENKNHHMWGLGLTWLLKSLGASDFCWGRASRSSQHCTLPDTTRSVDRVQMHN